MHSFLTHPIAEEPRNEQKASMAKNTDDDKTITEEDKNHPSNNVGNVVCCFLVSKIKKVTNLV